MKCRIDRIWTEFDICWTGLFLRHSSVGGMVAFEYCKLKIATVGAVCTRLHIVSKVSTDANTSLHRVGISDQCRQITSLGRKFRRFPIVHFIMSKVSTDANSSLHCVGISDHCRQFTSFGLKLSPIPTVHLSPLPVETSGRAWAENNQKNA